MSREIQFTSFENFLAFMFKTQKVENDEYVFLNVFANTKTYDKVWLENCLADDNFKNQEIDYNYPDMIVTENVDRVYYVGLDAYDKNVEYFTVRIKK